LVVTEAFQVNTQAVILAAGQGKRLLPLTEEIPKALLPLDLESNTTILGFQVSTLQSLGIDDIVVVVGHGSERVFSALGEQVRYVENPLYLTTNSIYSFALAMDGLKDDVLILNGDVLFHPGVIKRLLAARHNAVLAVDTRAVLDEETMKVRLDGERVVEISKALEPSEAHAENLGVVRFRGEGLKVLKQTVSSMVAQGEVNRWIPAAFQEMLSKTEIYALDVAGLPWIEIDFASDLEMAQKDIFPKIVGGGEDK
jgi:choline kinase